jgi:hypothetical protein
LLTVITFKWDKPGYRSKFTAQHVNTLASMVRRNYHGPHRFVCVTDQGEGIDERVEVMPMWKDFVSAQSPHHGRNPSCYRRLKLFAPDAGEIFGPRMVCLDLDMVITGDVTSLWDRPQDIVLLKGSWSGDPRRVVQPYNGAMLMLRAGKRPKVYTEFDPDKSPRLAFKAGFRGSDQGWYGYILGGHEATWGHADGVYSYRLDLRHHQGRLPQDARVVNFHGVYDPWGQEAQRLKWVRAHYRITDEPQAATLPEHEDTEALRSGSA